MTIEPVRLDAEELAEMLGFIAGWLASDRDDLNASLRRYVGSDGHGINELHHDVQRFEFLLGSGDGSALPGDEES